jgi:integrase
MRATLTDRGVSNLKARPKRYVHADPELRGHYVRVQPSGAKAFVIIANRPSGQQVWHTIGSADVLKIEDAREQAREAIRRIRQGEPPVEPPALSFKNVAENWLQRHVDKKKLRTTTEIKRCLAKYVFPHWENREFTGIKRSDVAALLDQIEDDHGPRQSDVCLTILSSMANWFTTRNDDYLSPFVRSMRRSDNNSRDRILDDDELRAVWLQAERSGDSFGALIMVLLLTAQRRGAVLRMKWDDIDANGVWTIASEERAKGNIGSVKLPAQALSIIAAQPRLASNPYVFAASRGSCGPMNRFGKKVEFDKACGVSNWTLHDLRRTSRSLMSRAGVDRDIAERVLGHVIRGVAGIYDRHQYFDEKAGALAKLATLIDSIVERRDAKVLPMTKRKKT